MDTKQKKRVLREGPDRSSSEDLITAAWLIRGGYAEGSVQKDFTQVTDVPANVIWHGVTDKGTRYLSESVFREKFLIPVIVSVVGGLIVVLVAGVLS